MKTKKLKSPNYAKIFPQTPKKSRFVDTICAVDSALSKFFDYEGEYYSNGEQTLFYKVDNISIVVTIQETDE